ncbi:MAG TPA: hypothetical protein VHA13_05680 [Gammaproteobacteria bacterium]|nr:hypothetical protein [Gammaproteobacteria bacterium]
MNGSERYEQTISSWRWAHASELIRVWGQPEQKVALPNDNEVYIYTKNMYRNYPAPSQATSISALNIKQNNQHTVYLPDPNEAKENFTAFFLECKTLFEIDPLGIVVDVRSQGNDCTADTSFFLSNSNQNSHNPDTPPRNKSRP